MQSLVHLHSYALQARSFPVIVFIMFLAFHPTASSASPLAAYIEARLNRLCSNASYAPPDEELCPLLLNHTNNVLTEDHSHYFENVQGSFGRIYDVGVDNYTISFTPTELSYKAYSAVGYGLANTILVTRNVSDGFVLIDAGSGAYEANKVIQAYKDAGVLPSTHDLELRAVIYTHNHIDHSGGSNEWIVRSKKPPCPVSNDGVDGRYFARRNCVEVICQKKVTDAVINTATRTGQQIDTRSAYMYGAWSYGGAINNGIGPPEAIMGPYFRPPSKTMTEYLDLRILGMQMWLQYVPSETNDEIIVFMPDGTNNASSASVNQLNLDGVMDSSVPRTPPQELGTGLLFAAEAIQGPPTFPNLYSLRGTTFRNPLTWYESVDIIRLYQSWGMIGSHGPPVMGFEHVQTVLVNFRDAIQFVHDQTLRHIRKGLIPDELVQIVGHVPNYLLDNLATITEGLPSRLETPQLDPRDFLRTFYGSVPQGVRAMYAGYLGWNKGDPTFFDPLPPTERANRYLELMGGASQVLEYASGLYDRAAPVENKNDLQWVAEVLSYVLSSSTPCVEERNLARALKSKALLSMASTAEKNESMLELDYFSLNPNWRNWLIVGGEEEAFRLDSDHAFPFASALSSSTIQQGVPPRNWVQQWCWRFNSDNLDLNGTTFGWEFLANESWWGNSTQQFILEVMGQVVRLVDDAIEVERMWPGISLGVSIEHRVFAELIASDTSRAVNGSVNDRIFVDKLDSLLAAQMITKVAGTRANIVAFYDPTRFDAKPAYQPSVVERPVPKNPNTGTCTPQNVPATTEGGLTGLEKLDAQCAGGCVLTLIIFVVLFGVGCVGLGGYVFWVKKNGTFGQNRNMFQSLPMAS